MGFDKFEAYITCRRIHFEGATLRIPMPNSHFSSHPFPPSCPPLPHYMYINSFHASLPHPTFHPILYHPSSYFPHMLYPWNPIRRLGEGYKLPPSGSGHDLDVINVADSSMLFLALYRLVTEMKCYALSGTLTHSVTVTLLCDCRASTIYTLKFKVCLYCRGSRQSCLIHLRRG